MNHLKFTELSDDEVRKCLDVIQTPENLAVIKEAIDILIQQELTGFEHIAVTDFEKHKSKLEGIRQVLGTLTLSRPMLLKHLRIKT